jgi:hypothetical protein
LSPLFKPGGTCIWQTRATYIVLIWNTLATWNGSGKWDTSICHVIVCIPLLSLHHSLTTLFKLQHSQANCKGDAVFFFVQVNCRLTANLQSQGARSKRSTFRQAFACNLRGKNIAPAPCLCLAIWSIFARRQTVRLDVLLNLHVHQIPTWPLHVLYYNTWTKLWLFNKIYHCRPRHLYSGTLYHLKDF